MSKEARAWAKKIKVALSPAERLVLWYLADRADESGFAFPSTKDIATRCAMGRRSVFRHIATLATLELLTIENRTRDNGGKASNGYRLALTPICQNGTYPICQNGTSPYATVGTCKDNEQSEGLKPQTPLTLENERAVVRLYKDGRLAWDDARWSAYGAPPGSPGCRLSPTVLAEYGYPPGAAKAA